MRLVLIFTLSEREGQKRSEASASRSSVGVLAGFGGCDVTGRILKFKTHNTLLLRQLCKYIAKNVEFCHFLPNYEKAHISVQYVLPVTSQPGVGGGSSTQSKFKGDYQKWLKVYDIICFNSC